MQKYPNIYSLYLLDVTQCIEKSIFVSSFHSILFVFQHDEGSNCGSLGSAGGKGRYLMFPHATDEVRDNNDKFSPCSIKHISDTLKLKKDSCFVGENKEMVSTGLQSWGWMFTLEVGRCDPSPTTKVPVRPPSLFSPSVFHISMDLGPPLRHSFAD